MIWQHIAVELASVLMPMSVQPSFIRSDRPLKSLIPALSMA